VKPRRAGLAVKPGHAASTRQGQGPRGWPSLD